MSLMLTINLVRTCLVLQVWKQHKAGSITEAIDSGLKDKFEEREASNALLVGLLCTQASIAVRPSMSEVVQMLTDTSSVIPSPKQPPFLNASVLSPEDTVSGSFMGSSALDDEPGSGPGPGPGSGSGSGSSTQKPDITTSPESNHSTHLIRASKSG